MNKNIERALKMLQSIEASHLNDKDFRNLVDAVALIEQHIAEFKEESDHEIRISSLEQKVNEEKTKVYPSSLKKGDKFKFIDLYYEKKYGSDPFTFVEFNSDIDCFHFDVWRDKAVGSFTEDANQFVLKD